MTEPKGRYARTTTSHTNTEFGWRQRVTRFAIALPLLSIAFLVLWQQTRFRALEADVAQHWLGVVLSGTVGRLNDVVFFPWTNGPMIGMQISAECTVALLVAPLVLIGALLVALTRFDIARLLIGVFVGTVVLVVVNQVRIAVIALSIQHWGIPGYDVSHKLVGTLIGLAGFTVALLIMLKLGTPARTRRSGHRSSS